MTITLRDGTQKARKPHTCHFCYRVIDPGEQYWSQVNISWHDDRLYTFKSCRHCEAMVTRHGLFDLAYDDEGLGADNIANWEPESLAALRDKAGWRMRWRTRSGRLLPIPGESS